MTNIGRPTVVDLYAGVGGLALGFEQAGFDVLAAVDHDPVHIGVHCYNFPQTEGLCGDIAQMSPHVVLGAAQKGYAAHNGIDTTWAGELDAIIGGPPCQGFSSIGKRLVDDERNQLVFHFFRMVRDLRPKFFIMENVPGMLQGGHSSVMRDLVEEFENAGYEVAKPLRTVDASFFGVPQARKRVFLLGSRYDQKKLSYPVSTTAPPERLAIDRLALQNNSSIPRCPTVWEAIGDLPDLDTFPELLGSDEVVLSDEILETMETRSSPYVRRLRELEKDPTDFSYARVWNRNHLTSSRRTRHTQESIRRFAETSPGETEPISRFYRLRRDGLCNTLRAGTSSERGAFTSPRPIHPVLPRVISVREAARLHSFPDWFRLHKTKWHGFRQIGNSVPPLLARAVAATVVDALGVRPGPTRKQIELGDESLLVNSMARAAEIFNANPLQIPQPRLRGAAK